MPSPSSPSIGVQAHAHRLPRLARTVASLAGWRRRAAALAAGAASVLALAPFHIWPVLALTLPVLVWLIDGAVAASAAAGGPKAAARHALVRAAGAGWWFAFGYFLAGLFWIGEAFLVEAETFAVLLPFAVTLMPAGLALFWAAAAAGSARLWRPGLSRVLVLALALAGAEWLRGHVLTGFPWNVLGYALTYPLPLMQSAAMLGIYGLTLVTVIALASPLVLLAEPRAAGTVGRIPTGTLAVLVLLLPLAAMALWGLMRLAGAEAEAADRVRVRLVQPSIPQREKWQPQHQRRIFAEHVALSQRDAAGRIDGAVGVDILIWPEAAMPFLPLQSPAALEAIGGMLHEGTRLITGALRREDAAGSPPGRRQVFNSILAFGTGGGLIASYDKVHLVPFGEYLPLQEALEAIGLEQLSRLRGGFASGARPRRLLRLPGLPALGPLVCYEAIFPGAIVEGGERPAALINVTNDGWFGNTTGPRQHLHQARVRAVEEGLAMLRSANNGISAIIDAKGRIVARLDLDAVGVIDGVLPAPLPPPLYARHGDWVFVMVWLACAGLALGLPKQL
jgi:apolipoprotein N-acyltransferase